MSLKRFGVVAGVASLVAVAWFLWPVQDSTQPGSSGIVTTNEKARPAVTVEGSSLPATVNEAHNHLLGQWKGELNPHPKDWEKGAGSLSIELPNGEVYVLQLEAFRPIGASRGVFRGKVEGEEFSQVVVSYVNLAVSGMIRLPEQEFGWEFRNAGEGKQIFEKVDLNELGECGVCSPVSLEEEE